MDMQLFIADGCKEALMEEKRRFCFLVDKHCMFSYQIASFHDKVQDNQKYLIGSFLISRFTGVVHYIENIVDNLRNLNK